MIIISCIDVVAVHRQADKQRVSYLGLSVNISTIRSAIPDLANVTTVAVRHSKSRRLILINLTDVSETEGVKRSREYLLEWCSGISVIL